MKQKTPNILLDIVTSAKKRGYITQDEILSIFPHPEDHIVELDQLYDKLMHSDIDVFESVAADQGNEKPIEDLEKEFPHVPEVKEFVNCTAPLLASAIRLRSETIAEKTYYEKAQDLKEKIMAAMNSPGKHPGVQNIQNIFREKNNRLFHWVKNRDVPAENNYAERELRPTVIARKVSHGSQSKAGARTRSILMSVLHTVKKRLRTGTVEDWLNEALQKYIHNPHIDPCSLLPDIPKD
jgi:hypothetical protein